MYQKHATCVRCLRPTWHHALKTTEVDVCTVVQQVEDLVSILLHLVLDVHLATALVLQHKACGTCMSRLAA